MPRSSPNSGARSIEPPNAWEPSTTARPAARRARKMVEERDRRAPDRLRRQQPRPVRPSSAAGGSRVLRLRPGGVGRVQRYRDRPWSDLVGYGAYNRHIACVMESADQRRVAADVAQPGRALRGGCSADGTDHAGLLHARLRRAPRAPPAPGARTRLGSVRALGRAQGIDGPAVSRSECLTL